jgi:hypothetical protein
MTPELLASLPMGSKVKLDVEVGTVVSVGPYVSIQWPESDCTNIVDTKSDKWKTFISWLEAA